MADPTTRLFRCLMLLQERRFWTGEALAHALGGVTTRTVRRDVERLRDLGFPVQATSGVGGGYALSAGAHLPPLPFDDDEAVAVAVGLRMAAAGSVSGLEGAAVRALAKLEGVLPTRLRARVRDLDAVSLRVGSATASVDADVLAHLALACRRATSVRLSYVSGSGERSARHLDPYRLAHTERRWYLVAWDRDRQDWRTFRVDRIAGSVIEALPYRARELPDPDVEGWVRRQLRGEGRGGARIRVHASAAEVLARMPASAGEVFEEGRGTCIVEAQGSDPRWVAIGLLMLGADVEVVEGDAVRQAFEELGRRCARAVSG